MELKRAVSCPVTKRRSIHQKNNETFQKKFNTVATLTGKKNSGSYLLAGLSVTAALCDNADFFLVYLSNVI